VKIDICKISPSCHPKKSLVGLKNFTKKVPNFLTRSKLLIPTLQIKIFAVLIPSWYLNWPKYEFVFGAIGEFSNG